MALFEPLQVGTVNVKNRIALPPLTRLRSDNQVPPPEAVEYYGSRAAAAPGTLLITEATAIAPAAVGHFYAPGIWSQEQIKAWKKVTDEVHKHGSFIYVQLWAHGRVAVLEDLKKVGNYDLVGPSPIAAPHCEKPRALTVEEIDEYVEWYAQASKNAMEAGFDGVEIHSANGYLLNQFLFEGSNNRTDEYGGSIENRSRFTLRVVDTITKAIGAGRTGIRFNPWGGMQGIDDKVSPIPQYSYLLAELEHRAMENERLAYVHIMEPRVVFLGHGSDSYGSVDRHANDFARQIWKGVIIRCGSFGRDNKLMEDLVTKDDKLLIGVGRLFISNPDIVNKIRNNTPPDMFVRKTFYWNGAKWPMPEGYTKDYVATPNTRL